MVKRVIVVQTSKIATVAVKVDTLEIRTATSSTVRRAVPCRWKRTGFISKLEMKRYQRGVDHAKDAIRKGIYRQT